ncbi:MAG: hypothetical protein U0232_06935 [Thermomicrobiales bacterium]
MLHGDAFWVIAVVCASAIRLGLLAEWGDRFRRHRTFGARAWLPWLPLGCLLGWLVLIQGDRGAGYILALPYGAIFEGYHIAASSATSSPGSPPPPSTRRPS